MATIAPESTGSAAAGWLASFLETWRPGSGAVWRHCAGSSVASPTRRPWPAPPIWQPQWLLPGPFRLPRAMSDSVIHWPWS